MSITNEIHNFDLPWLNSIDVSKELDEFRERGVKTTYKTGDFIKYPYDETRNVFYLTKGISKLSTLNENGDEKIMWFTRSPSLVGVAPFFTRNKSNGVVSAYTECEGLWFNESIFNQILLDDPLIYRGIVCAMSKKIDAFMVQLSWIAFNSSEKVVCNFLYSFALEMQRYLRLSVNEPLSLRINLTHQEISSITTVHRVTVTKVINNLKKSGIISAERNGDMTIHDMEALKEKAL